MSRKPCKQKQLRGCTARGSAANMHRAAAQVAGSDATAQKQTHGANPSQESANTTQQHQHQHQHQHHRQRQRRRRQQRQQRQSAHAVGKQDGQPRKACKCRMAPQPEACQARIPSIEPSHVTCCKSSSRCWKAQHTAAAGGQTRLQAGMRAQRYPASGHHLELPQHHNANTPECTHSSIRSAPASRCTLVGCATRVAGFRWRAWRNTWRTMGAREASWGPCIASL